MTKRSGPLVPSYSPAEMSAGVAAVNQLEIDEQMPEFEAGMITLQIKQAIVDRVLHAAAKVRAAKQQQS